MAAFAANIVEDGPQALINGKGPGKILVSCYENRVEVCGQALKGRF